MTTLTLQIKNIIRENTNSERTAAVYGNKYKNCRTVKTYATKAKNFPAIESELAQLAAENNVVITTKTIIDNSSWRPDSYIVRFPLDV